MWFSFLTSLCSKELWVSPEIRAAKSKTIPDGLKVLMREMRSCVCSKSTYILASEEESMGMYSKLLSLFSCERPPAETNLTNDKPCEYGSS